MDNTKKIPVELALMVARRWYVFPADDKFHAQDIELGMADVMYRKTELDAFDPRWSKVLLSIACGIVTPVYKPTMFATFQSWNDPDWRLPSRKIKSKHRGDNVYYLHKVTNINYNDDEVAIAGMFYQEKTTPDGTQYIQAGTDLLPIRNEDMESEFPGWRARFQLVQDLGAELDDYCEQILYGFQGNTLPSPALNAQLPDNAELPSAQQQSPSSGEPV